jgi:hypothetical protein
LVAIAIGHFCSPIRTFSIPPTSRAILTGTGIRVIVSVPRG